LRKSIDMAKQAAKVREELIANVSHEMRTPMNAILGMSNLLLKSELDKEQYDYISSIKQSSEILLGVINDILDISAIQNRKIFFKKEPFELNLLIDNLIKVMKHKVNEKALKFKVEIEESLPPVLIGDKLRLNQILYNLVGNAIKFTDEGYVKLTTIQKGKEEDKVWIKFVVEDTGIGISEDKLQSIFESFTRIRKKDRLFEGTGLGLPIAKNLVEQQGGEMGVESIIGKGSKFHFVLPFRIGDPAWIADGNKNDLPPIDIERAFELLLVEDHKMNQIVAKKTLEKKWKHISVTIAENGVEAIECLEKKRYDIVLMDIQMPVKDGLETTAYIRNEMPKEIAETPILAMTAHAHVSKNGMYRQYGMDDFVLKPFEPEQLFQKIEFYLKNRRK